MTRTSVALNERLRPLLGDTLPAWVEPRWFADGDALLEIAPIVEIGWFDTFDFHHTLEAYTKAENACWLNTMAAGVEGFPLDLMRERGVIFTNGAKLNARPIAEYVLMGMLSVAKGYREVVRAQDRREWLEKPPGRGQIEGAQGLVLGAGGIGSRVAELLRALGAKVTEARRTPAPGVLGEHEWRGKLGEFDWIVVAVPATSATDKMLGAAEFAAMKPGASIINIARGAVIDQDALLAALDAGSVGAAFLDVTDPEPLPADHPLWVHPGVQISMHLSGQSQDSLYRLAAGRFLENLSRWHDGVPLDSVVDLEKGY
ncbi:D-2-hydroxyacid dehydrogenase [Novosphingobium aquimarinum]|uniref:D-2-hydroxyacid dehydrogenase n=1 Tax=Novosphingobium aquimarinum TaxID=2682494 RepID=UPI0012EC5A9D|nr:D-2-hydroxyacid dehydrogenase [Novosphingobium aquimarinum]